VKKEHNVPHLDLAPKLKRPLQLWKPLDYLRLLYWCFLFPQALHWYVEQHSSAQHSKTATRYRVLALRKNLILDSLTCQIFLLSFLTTVFPPIVSIIVQSQRLKDPLITIARLTVVGVCTVLVVAVAVVGEPATRICKLVRMSALVGVILCTEYALLPQQVSGFRF
jgi:hypothetical protein